MLSPSSHRTSYSRLVNDTFSNNAASCVSRLVAAASFPSVPVVLCCDRNSHVDSPALAIGNSATPQHKY